MSIIIKSGSSSSLATVNTDGSIKAASQITSSTGTVAAFRPDGVFRAASDPTSLFFDNFETFNQTDLWALVGTPPTTVVGQVSLAAGTIAGAGTILRTIPTFPSFSNAFIQAGAVLALDAASVVGNKRFWGLGFPATTPTASVPLSSGVVFEASDVDGALYGAVYANGVRTKSVALTRPADGAMHRFVLYYRTSKVYFEIDGLTVGSIDNPNPSVSAMPFVLGSVNVTAQTLSPTMNVTVVGVADTSRNHVQLADGTYPFRKVQVGKSGGLSIKGALAPLTTTTVAAAATGTLGPIDVTESGTVTFVVKNTTPATPYTGNPVLVFEQSDDNVSWAPLNCVRADTNQNLSTHVLAAGVANVETVLDAVVEGITWVRCRVTTGTTTGALTLVAQPGGLAFMPSVVIAQPVRTPVIISGVALAVGTSGVETLLTLTHQRGLAAAIVTNSFVVPAGKRFKLQSMVLTQVGNNTATAASTIFRFRYNSAGAATATSTPVMLQSRLASPAQAVSFQQLALPVPEGFELTGDGIGQFGITATSTYTTNPPTIDVMVVGYEY